MGKLLTKSKYLEGLQCPKLLWMEFNAKDEIPAVDEATQHIFDQGHMVGEYAKKLYPEGIDVPNDDFLSGLKKSKKLLELRKPLFEAGFRYGDCYSRADILVPVEDDRWDLVEVKSSTSVKDINLHDVSFQRYCYENSGLKIRKCYLMHINNKYVRQGDIEPDKLFTKTDITDDVDVVSYGIEKRIEKFFNIIRSRKTPEKDIGDFCTNPYECPVMDTCWKILPEKNVFELYRGKQKAFELLSQDIKNLSDIPPDTKLTEKQKIQLECEINNKIHANENNIKKFIESLEFPLYYLDFETYNSAIPPYDGLRPYQQIPFQFSLHIVHSFGSEPKHHSFIFKEKADPRKSFMENLEKLLGDKGSIIAYNQNFEKKIIEQTAEKFPEYKTWSKNILPRFKDLIVPFKNFDYYNPLQKGSCSLKNVLPAVTGENYEDMEIGNGEEASRMYYKVIFGEVTETEKNKVLKGLEEYCGLDTEGMIWIIDGLRKIVEE